MKAFYSIRSLAFFGFALLTLGNLSGYGIEPGENVKSGEVLVRLKAGGAGVVSYGLYCMASVSQVSSNATGEGGGDLVLILRNTGAKSINMNGVTVEDFKLLDSAGKEMKCYLWSTPRTMGFGESTVIHLAVDHYAEAIQPWTLRFKSKPGAFVPVDVSIFGIEPSKSVKGYRQRDSNPTRP